MSDPRQGHSNTEPLRMIENLQKNTKLHGDEMVASLKSLASEKIQTIDALTKEAEKCMLPALQDIKEAVEITNVSLKRAVNALSQQAIQLQQEIRISDTAEPPLTQKIGEALHKEKPLQFEPIKKIQKSWHNMCVGAETNKRMNKPMKKLVFDSSTEDEEFESGYIIDTD